MDLYPLARTLHVLFVTLFVGGSVALEMALTTRKRSPSPGLDQLIAGRLKPLEAASAAGTLVFGISLLFLNPMGMKIFTSGGWSHMKVTAGLLSTLLILVSHAGLSSGAKWVRPVRGIAQLFMLLALFAIEYLRPIGV